MLVAGTKYPSSEATSHNCSNTGKFDFLDTNSKNLLFIKNIHSKNLLLLQDYEILPGIQSRAQKSIMSDSRKVLESLSFAVKHAIPVTRSCLKSESTKTRLCILAVRYFCNAYSSFLWSVSKPWQTMLDVLTRAGKTHVTCNITWQTFHHTVYYGVPKLEEATW